LGSIERLDHDALVVNQQSGLAASRRTYTLGKFRVLEVVGACAVSGMGELNADFEDHAAHEYALLVQEHPEWETVPFESQFQGEFGAYDSLADMFRQIGYDEALHRQESEIMMTQPRFA
jgi:hypothetical protein